MKIIISILMLVMISGCSFSSKFQTPFSVINPLKMEISAEDRKTDTTYLSEKAQTFIDAYKHAKKTPNAQNLRHYIDAGITYSHLLCKDYFDRLTYTKAQRDFAQKETNLVSGLTTGLMGLAKASATSVAGVSSLFSFSEASFDAYNEAFIVSPDLSMLERLVKEKQSEEEAVIFRKLNEKEGKWPDKIESLEQAERTLSDYIYHCTVNGIRTLLDSSIKERATQLNDNTRKIQADKKIKASVIERIN